mgnify:FL=1
MDINGWNYLFENLPHWGIRERFSYVYDTEHIQSPFPSSTPCVL